MNRGLGPDADEDRTPRQVLLDSLDRLDRGEGVGISDLLNDAGKTSACSLDELRDTFDRLKRQGEVYVVEDRVKQTDRR